MTHYDEQYEEENKKYAKQAEEARLRKVANSKGWLHERINQLNDDDLFFAQELLSNLAEYRGFFNILDRNRK